MTPLQNKNRTMIYKVTGIGLFTAFAMLLSYVETLIPFYFGAPGMKLGLPNFFVLLLLEKHRYREAALVNLLRILLTGFLFGNLFSIAYSIAGALCSYLIMLLVIRLHFSVVPVSVCGGISHNIGQLITACAVLGTGSVIYYTPVLLTAGAVTGVLIGILVKRCMPLLNRYRFFI